MSEASLLLVAMDLAPSSFLFLVVRPGALTSVFAPSRVGCLRQKLGPIPSTYAAAGSELKVTGFSKARLSRQTEIVVWSRCFHPACGVCLASTLSMV